ncbi:dihydrofolate reductase [Methylomarinovum tepidoasis]|uniref:Dihydrofolate reductase n=1 Tax=Methylomarinovum tepidoasis TaxID=2840183 RepID=A0AAU9BXA5_9GAMM|nr:dihydrofolate reductase [Methylomarinovum sp. IN45]BCX88310.1 dihydrofolate reductase [Methylomarinovum sp. IN45]
MSRPSRISLIVAMARGRVIGHRGRMPWHLSEDLRRFRRITWGKPILMGRRTFEAIGRPLPGRVNIVLSRSPDFRPDGCQVASSLEAALELAGGQELMVIGGSHVYRHLLPQADLLYLTLIDADFPGDTFFPPWEAAQWQEIEREERAAGAAFPHPYRFVTLRRISPACGSRDNRY